MKKKIFLVAILLLIAMTQCVEARPRVFVIGEPNVEDIEGSFRIFDARVEDSSGLPSNVTWTLNGIEVQINESVPSGELVRYAATAVAGNHILVVSATNAEGYDEGSWVWVVTPSPSPTEIPEFPNIALPVVVLLGLVFIFSQKKRR